MRLASDTKVLITGERASADIVPTDPSAQPPAHSPLVTKTARLCPIRSSNRLFHVRGSFTDAYRDKRACSIQFTRRPSSSTKSAK